MIPNYAQTNWSLVASHPIGTMINADYDRVGNVFWSESTGKVVKMVETEVFQVYLPEQSAEGKLDAWNSLNVFVFYPDFQLCRWLNQRMGLERDWLINDETINFASFVAPASDNQLWIWDQEQLMIKKYNTTTKRVTTEARLDIFSIKLIKEYQNNLYIANEDNNLHILDYWGNVMGKLKLENEDASIHFYQNYLYYLKENQLVWKALYENETTSKPEIKQLPEVDNLVDILWNGQYLYMFTDNQLHIYQKKS